MNTDKEKQELLSALEKYKRENEILHQKIKSLDNIIEESAVAILIGNTKGEIIEANKKILEISQFSYNEILNRKLSNLLVKEHIPESISRKDLNERSDEHISEQLLVRKDGKKLFVTVQTKLLSDGRYQLIINNINKRKKAELALIDSEKRYRLLSENIHDVVWTATKSLKIIYISSSVLKITGYTPDVYYAKPLHQIVTPISYQLIRETFRRESKLTRTGTIPVTGNTISLEIKLIHKKQQNVWVEMISTVIRNQFGEPVGFQGVLKNIDAHKKTQEILAKKKHHYDFALKATGSGIWELDADLTHINIDHNLLNILGYQSDEINPMLNEWINLTVKKDRILVIDILQDLLDGKKVNMTYECRRIHRSGEILWFQDYVEAIVDERGKVIEIIGTSKNTTQEKITEEKKYRYYAGLQILTDSAFELLKFPDLTNICEYTGKILLQNIPNSIIVFSHINSKTKECKPYKFSGVNQPKLLQMIDEIPFKLEEVSFILPQKEFNLLERKTLIEYKGGFKAFVDAVFPSEDAERINKVFNFNNLHIIGQSFNSHLSGSISIISREETVIKNKEFIEAFINLVSVIINRKNIEIELKNINATKDKFFSIISHDLKNPFNSFIGFSGLIIQNIENITKEKILEFSKIIHNGALRSYEMMQNLFEWIQSQKGYITVRPVKVSIPEFIESILRLFSGGASKKNISMSYISANEIDFYTDIDILNTILRNLVSNAIKFTNIDGEIIISYKEVGQSLQFEVRDNGVGISAENISRLFNVHTNKSSDGTEREKGTGLGLVLCQEFVELLGGKIKVESEEGKGSCFTFIIPNLNKELISELKNAD